MGEGSVPRKTITMGKHEGKWHLGVDLSGVQIVLAIVTACAGLWITTTQGCDRHIDTRVQAQITARVPEMQAAAEKAHAAIVADVDRKLMERKEAEARIEAELLYIRAKVDEIGAYLRARR